MKHSWYTTIFAYVIIGCRLAMAAPPDYAWLPQAPRLSAPTGEVIHATNVQELFAAANTIKPGGTILLADGQYELPSVLTLATDNVTLRSRSGNRHDVILDGTNSRHGELVLISGEGITVADLTIQNIKWNGFKIASEHGAQRARIYNCVVHNIWQRGVKASHIPPAQAELYPRDCRVQFCLFYNDRPKRFEDDPTDTTKTYNGNYIGGIDVKNTHGWTISDNVFVGIQGRTREGRACVYISEEGHDCVIERNAIVDCDVGIALGNPSRVGDWLHAIDCVVRNNFITGCPETGILACYTKNCQVMHNTIHEPSSRFGRLIWVQNVNKDLVVENNLLSGAALLVTSDDVVESRLNYSAEDLSQLFADADTGDLHLVKPVKDIVNTAARLPLVSHDIDSQPRLDQPDIGADEFVFNQDAESTPSQETITQSRPAKEPSWVQPMQKVHAKFQGQFGYIAQFGDSITFSMAFWTPMGWDDPQQYLTQNDGLPKTPAGKRWRDVIQGERDKGPKHGNYSGWTVKNVLGVVDDVLENQSPEVAIIMVGTNDIASGNVPKSYKTDLEQVVKKCLAAHCIPILNTIPPRRNRETSVREINQIIKDVAKTYQVPLVDYHAEILKRRPNGSWQDTLISKDGVHPTGGKTNIYTTENLKNSGYALRNWLNFQAVRDVYFHVLHAKNPGEPSD
ncbi:GDSL-type esterase/lipase family protein [Thalassoroseus pseudoceratinae]|uniref:GDSL-type esterase/lipase family protein n=1 Tax=Thalassoroseus pseudoceratinae TaxID=2713176 RepID=UPI00141F5B9D|nr:GDSL-type esterase/lipase family protein [Thalassoroseus pseudoceratinae]